jgi:hypothetical protein
LLAEKYGSSRSPVLVLRTKFLYQRAAARSTIAPSAGARCAFMRLYCWALGRCILQKPNLKAFPFG